MLIFNNFFQVEEDIDADVNISSLSSLTTTSLSNGKASAGTRDKFSIVVQVASMLVCLYLY